MDRLVASRASAKNLEREVQARYRSALIDDIENEISDKKVRSMCATSAVSVDNNFEPAHT
jgi:hypothetical protein